MNFLMAGMVLVMTFGMKRVPAAHSPLSSAFWFIMSMALLVGFITAYPMNWWLVSHRMKHGMMTMRPLHKSEDEAGDKNKRHDSAPTQGTGAEDPDSKSTKDRDAKVSTSVLAWMTILSWTVFALGLSVATIFEGR